MAVTTGIKAAINRLLACGNLRLDTLTGERRELARLRELASRGHFDEPAYRLPSCFSHMSCEPVFEGLRAFADRFEDFRDPSSNETGYTFDNDYYTSPDAEVLYTMVRTQAPRRIVEIGCGNSTRIARLAITDAGLDTRLVAIDPAPRTDVGGLADDVHRCTIESPEGLSALDGLSEGDLLFIDSSHYVKAGNDVTTLLLNVVPALPAGVLIHFHDVFLPYEYPRDWLTDRGMVFEEQYLVHAMLIYAEGVEVLWAGAYLQRNRGDFESYFRNLDGRRAGSLWLRTGRRTG